MDPASLPTRTRRRATPAPTGFLLAVLCGVLGALAAVARQDAPVPPPAPAPARRPPACTSSAHRAFDFWVGDWAVKNPQGKQVGTNEITLVAGRCAVHELWRGAGGVVGESLSIYDAGDQAWHQSWVDSSGMRLELVGRAEAGGIVMEGATPPGPAGPKAQQHRVRWTPLAGGAVRQLWESSEDGGKSWTVTFDGRYERQG